MNRIQLIQTASLIAVVGNAFLAILKIVTGLTLGSLAVTADGIDSATDILTSLITLFSARLIMRPPSAKYPYGFRRIESIATKLLSFVIFFAGAQLAMETTKMLYHGVEREAPGMLALVVTVVSIVVKFALARYQTAVGHQTGSSMLVANGKNMQNDILISASVLVGLLFTLVLDMPLLDAVTGLLVSLWIIKVALEIYLDASVDLMDGVDNPELYPRIIACVESVPGARNPHRIRINKLGNLYVITLDMEVAAELTVAQSHQIAQRVEKAIIENVENVYDIVTHVEPLHNFEPNEAYGVSKQSLG